MAYALLIVGGREFIATGRCTVATWLARWGDRGLFWVMLAVVLLTVFVLNALADAAPFDPRDWELAMMIAEKDSAPEV